MPRREGGGRKRWEVKVGGKGGRKRWEEKVGGKGKRCGREEMALHGKG